MKKLAVLLILVLNLTGCSRGDEQLHRGMELRTALLRCQICTFEVNIAADYGDMLHEFSLACQSDAQGNLSFTVTEPETIAGISGSITAEGGKLTFDDVALYFDLLAEDQISPISGPWILMRTLMGGYVRSYVQEGELLHLTIDDSYEEDALQLDIWLDEHNSPIQAEILYEGRRIVTMGVENFQIQ